MEYLYFINNLKSYLRLSLYFLSFYFILINIKLIFSMYILRLNCIGYSLGLVPRYSYISTSTFTKLFTYIHFYLNKKNIIIKMLNKVSIILPTYNRSFKCINVIKDVLFTQIYKNIELILINDGSDKEHTANLEIFLQENKDDENFKKINYIYHENKGLAASLNVGLDVFKGDYVTWISDDNKIFDNFIKELADSMENNIDFTYSNYVINNYDKEKIYVYNKYNNTSDLVNNFKGMAAFMWSREIIKKIGYFNTEYSGLCEDYDYEIRTFLETDKILHINKYLIEFYVGEDTQSHKNFKKMKDLHETIRIKYQDKISR